MQMAHQIVLSALYPEMEEATIGRWSVTEGATVEEGQALAELITDKVAYEYQSPAAGVVLAILPAEKSVVPVGTVLAIVGKAEESVATVLPQLQAENRRLAEAREASLTAILQATAVHSAAPANAGGRAVRATPAARRLARERGVDLTTLSGSGPDGMISVDDIPG